MLTTDNIKTGLTAAVRLVLELFLAGGCLYLAIRFLEGKGPFLRESLRWIFG